MLKYVFKGLCVGYIDRCKCTLIDANVDIHIQPIADRVAQHLEIISIFFNLVPGIPGFS